MMRSLRVFGVVTASTLLTHSAIAVVAAPMLDIAGQSLTSYLVTDKSRVQNLRPRFDQRGVDIDGMLRSPMPLGWAIAGDPTSSGHTHGRILGDVTLGTGTYTPLDVDLALPTLGYPIVIGRTYNNRQIDSAGARFDSDGYQGWNWSQTAQPELVYKAGSSADLDTLYLVFGADRYIEFQRTGESSAYFKAKNGAAGVIEFFDDEIAADSYTYYDQRGGAMTFGAGNAGNSAWQLQSMQNSAGHTATFEYDSSGRLTTAYDASLRRYSFTYSTFGGYTRLSQVKAEIQSGGSWTSPIEVGRVEYDFYTTTDAGKGLAGDLRLVTITTPVSGSSSLVRRKYYRYYTNSWSNADGSRGDPHAIKMVVGFEGTRSYDYAGDSTFDQDYYAETDANLKPYADVYLEYVSGSDQRVWKGYFNGNCGCAGGTNGVFTLSYTDASGYSTAIANTSYDTSWGKRTVVAQPDGTYSTHYFDEVGQVLGHVLTSGDPASSPAKAWVDWVDRNSSGQVTYLYSPASISGYTHSTGTVSKASSAGLVTAFTRISTGNLAGMRTATAVQQGTSGSPTTVSSVSLSERQLDLGTGTTGVSIPQVDSSSTYPSGSALTTNYSYTYWSGTNTVAQYLAAKSQVTTNPTVSTGNNGSGSATSASRYFREDGSTVFSVDAGGIITYSGRNGYAQSSKQIADANTATTGDFNSGDAPSTWSLSSSGTPIHAVRTWTYDEQGRPTSATQPGVNGTRTLAWTYTTLTDGRFGSFAYPRKVSTTYYGPVAYSLMNHAGKTERTATISLGSSGSTSAPSSTPSGTDWSRMVDMIYDSTGGRLLETRTYTSTTAYDTATTGYDSMGRVWRTKDATGTVRRTVFDERGQAIESWIGLCDSSFSGGSSGTDDMTKVEVREYDNNASAGGGNGLLTKVTRDEDGNWGTTSDQRATTLTYDFRNRAVVTVNPLAPHSVTKYDNASRSTAVGQYSSSSGLSASTDPTTTSSNRVALNETAYDERGQVYRTTRWEITQSTGAKGSSLSTDNWYDASGRLAKAVGSRITKTAYDRLGRAIAQYVMSSTVDTTYAASLTLTSDTVLEQTVTGLDSASGLPLIQYSIQREHDRSVTGSLDLDGDASLLNVRATDLRGRAQITAMWYDDWDRVIDAVNYGTNGGSDLNRSGLSCPSRSDTALRTTTMYDDFGRAWKSLDPTSTAGVESRTEFDFAGRRIKSTDNYTDGTPGGGTNNDQDRVTEFAYTSGLLTSQTRKMPSSSDDQVTTYTYGTVKGSGAGQSKIATGHLLKETVLPEQTSGQSAADRTYTTTYNSLGETLTTTDPVGTVIGHAYDLAGRLTSREVSTFGSGVDTRVKSISTTFNTRGLTASAAELATGSTVLDELSYDYDGWGNLTTFTQDPDSAVSGGSGRAAFTHTYSYGVANTSDAWQMTYLTQWTQPGSVTIVPDYTASTIDTKTRRVSGLYSPGFAEQYSAYDYMGSGSVVGAWVACGRTVYGTSYDPNATNPYTTYSTYLDNFNRPIKTQWVMDNASGTDPAFVDLETTYTRVSAASTVQDNVLKDSAGQRAFDQFNTIDALRRVVKRDEGALNSGKTAIDTGKYSRVENLNRNLLGRVYLNQINLDAAANSNYTSGTLASKYGGEMDDTRTLNKRSELRSRSVYDKDNPSTPATITLAYDKNGNLTDDGELYSYTYDAFNRLVQVKKRGTSDVVANYTYNALGQRVSEQYDCNDSGNSGATDGVTDSYDPVFFIANDRAGRRVATFRGSDTNPKETFIYHANGTSAGYGPGYAGGVMLRDRDSECATPEKWATTSADATRAERYFYFADARGSIMALVSASGTLAEQYRYSPTGVPFGIPGGDMNADGKVEGATGQTDLLIVQNTAYEVRKDLDLDGDVDGSDQTIVGAASGRVSGTNTHSTVSVANRVGFVGNEHRVLDRWVSQVMWSKSIDVDLRILESSQHNSDDDEGSSDTYGNTVVVAAGPCCKCAVDAVIRGLNSTPNGMCILNGRRAGYDCCNSGAAIVACEDRAKRTIANCRATQIWATPTIPGAIPCLAQLQAVNNANTGVNAAIASLVLCLFVPPPADLACAAAALSAIALAQSSLVTAQAAYAACMAAGPSTIVIPALPLPSPRSSGGDR